jgi:16S rRNA G527 N7-methylase RsmG
LETLKQKLDLPNLEIINERVENAVPGIINGAQNANLSTPAGAKIVFTARALAPLVKILDWTAKTGQTYVLLKGRSAQAEIDEAGGKYRFRTELHPSETGDGIVIKLTII